MALTSQILSGDTGEQILSTAQLDPNTLTQVARDYRTALNQTQPSSSTDDVPANDEGVTSQAAPLPPVYNAPPAPVVLPPVAQPANDSAQSDAPQNNNDDVAPLLAPVIAAPLIADAITPHRHHHRRHPAQDKGYYALKVPAPSLSGAPSQLLHNNLQPRPAASVIQAALHNLQQYAQSSHVHFTHMNPNFLVVVSKMVSDMHAHGEHIVITSGFRTAGEQNYLRHHRGHHGISRVVARGESNHQRGDALDIRTNYAHLAQYAVNYGLVSGSAFHDPMHVSMPPVGSREYRAGARFALRHQHSAARFAAAHDRRLTDEKLGRHGSRLAENTAHRPARHPLAMAGSQPAFAS